jgi:hypothetical protein
MQIIPYRWQLVKHYQANQTGTPAVTYWYSRPPPTRPPNPPRRFLKNSWVYQPIAEEVC